MTPADLLHHHDTGLPWACGPGEAVGQDVALAYQRQLAVRALRLARGEQPRGFKIGFTNRGIWPLYEVYAPIWGTVWDTGLQFCSAEEEASVDLAHCSQPRIEPEVVFGMAATPPPGASAQELFEAIAWVAPGFEVVQSHLPDWKFCAADTVADGALHARLVVGPRTPLRALAHDAAALGTLLADAQLQLLRDGEVVASGVGANVLDNPLLALRHFVHELQACPGAPALLPGDVVTTGTWTDAWPVAAGQAWQSRFSPPLPGLGLRFR